MPAWQEQELPITHSLHSAAVPVSSDLAPGELHISHALMPQSRRIGVARPNGSIALNGSEATIPDSVIAESMTALRDAEPVQAQASVEYKTLFAERDGLMAVHPLLATGLWGSAVEEYHKARVAFVNKMGWLGNITSDKDSYDEDPNTLYSLKMKEASNGQEDVGFVAGLRLTGVPAVTESMSFDMLVKNPDMQRAAAENSFRDENVRRAVARGRLWDVTRQIVQLDGSASPGEVSQGVPEAFGMGIGITCPSGERDTVWLFATTKELKEYLERSGVHLEVLAEGFASPEDEQTETTTYLCYTKPAETMVRAYSGDADNRRQARFYEGLIKGAELAGRAPDL